MDGISEIKTAVNEISVITKSTKIKGNIRSNGSVEVVGAIDGNIDILGKLNIVGSITGNSKAGEVFAGEASISGDIMSEGAVKVGAGTVIIGNLNAASTAISGAVKGNIDVKGPVILDSSAVVMGDIKSKVIQVNNGAVLEGKCSQCYSEVNISEIFQ